MATIEEIRAAFPDGKLQGNEWVTLCPVHPDRNNPNLRIKIENGKVLARCTKECSQAVVWNAVSERLKLSGNESRTTGLTLAEYAALKKLPVDFLKSLGTTEEDYYGKPSVRHAYHDEKGNLTGYKFRLSDSSHNTAWKQYDKQSKSRGVYGLLTLILESPETVVICEGESDQQTLTLLGIPAIGISGMKNWRPEIADLPLLQNAREILVIQEPNAETFARRVSESFPYGKARVVTLPAKDPSDLWIQSATPESFMSAWERAVANAKQFPPLWREKFHTVDELPDGEIEFLIEHVLPKGVCFVGALSGTGKTWFCLSMARALTTGKKFVGNYAVPHAVPVVYLCPEMNARAFKHRLKRFGINDNFYCQTISDGAPIDFTDPELATLVKAVHPVVFLDTAIRFSNVDDENSASQNARGLARAVFGLIHLGAQAVVCLHHRAKDNATQEREMTLENVLRGSGDLGAMCDVVWGLQYDKGSSGNPQYLKDSRKLVRLQVRCVKGRDFIPPDDFRIQLDPFIDEIADMVVLAENESANETDNEVERLSKVIEANPTASIRQIGTIADIGRNRVEKLASKAGWSLDETTRRWKREEPESDLGLD